MRGFFVVVVFNQIYGAFSLVPYFFPSRGRFGQRTLGHLGVLHARQGPGPLAGSGRRVLRFNSVAVTPTQAIAQGPDSCWREGGGALSLFCFLILENPKILLRNVRW